MMVDTKLSATTETAVTGSSVAEERAVDHSMALVEDEEEEVVVSEVTRTTDNKGVTTATIIVRAEISTRMATRIVKVVVSGAEVVWTDLDLTVVEWNEEALGVVRGVPPEVGVDTEVAKPVGKAYQLVVLGLSSSASEHARHDRLSSQPPQHFS